MDSDVEFDAVILAGGRSSRLGGQPKQWMTYRGATLLQLSLDAARGAAGVAVVGPEDGALPAEVLTCREDPPFAGPAAAVAAGLAALAYAGALKPFTLVLACDMPRAGTAVQALRDGIRDGAEGVMAVDQDGRRQPLLGFYSTAALQRSVQDLASRGALINGSVMALLASLDVQLVTVPAGSTDDVDTWDDAAALGVAGQEP
ncbi:molybdenum cofactor guanylyltransferase [Arthrobacter sp. CDRTa11]|uniref:molybdenum cofactor guanylyltransferase n=1 Tax=Arthrobacter sp. CDRTa11 TaxID=2651199 RepID=UPI002265BC98|nr:NTP transferase domain-containing protein [Arthrobacter sp. CDRTa11]